MPLPTLNHPKHFTMTPRITRTLLLAAAAVGAATSAQAYNVGDWVYSQPYNGWNGFIGDNTNQTIGTLNLDSTRTDAGLYSHATYYYYWNFNYYGAGNPDNVYVYGTVNGSYGNLGYGSQSGTLGTGTYVASSNSSGFEVIPLGTNYLTLHEEMWGDYNAYADWWINAYERSFQVARTNDSTGSQGFGTNSAFQLDNYDTSAYYGSNIGGRSYSATNVLDTARYWSGEGYTSLPGSVVRTGDMLLGGFGSLEGLYAKDGGWLDIRGDLTVGANGTVYIREGEITSDVYTQYNNTGAGHLGRTNFESNLNGEGAFGNGGILSVRQHFAQDMYATDYETLGFRDGAVNSQAIYIDGDGFQGGNGAFGSLRSITGSNTQNGNIGIGWNGAQYSTIGVDIGSTLTINGRINGVNGTYSNADKDLVLNVASGLFVPESTGTGLILNGDIRSSVRDVIQTNDGTVVLNSANAMSGSYYAVGGAAVVHHSGALGANTAYATDGGTIALDARNAYPSHLGTNGDPTSTANLTIANDIQIGGTGFLAGGALVNASGNNTITGTVTVGTNGYLTESTPVSDATIGVFNGTQLTVSGLTAHKTLNGFVAPYVSTLTIDTQNSTETIEGEEVVHIGTFINTGSTGLIDKVIKNGDGDAYLGAADAALLSFEVNGGRLFIDSLSTNPTNFGTFEKTGSSALVIQDTAAEDDAYYGQYNVNAGTLATALGANAHGDVYVYAAGTLGGKGTFTGDIHVHGGHVAPGFSPGILTVSGDYINNIVGAGGGILDLELAGLGGAGAANGHDQLRVSGDILLSNAAPADYSIIKFIDIDGFEAGHGNVFQVIANTSGGARNTFDKFDLSQTVTSLSDRVLFDHSTGKAYGTGLTTSQNFSHYATNRNQAEIGRALWMEAIDYDKSGTTGELSAAFIASAYNPVAAGARTGLKAWILTSHDAVLGERATDLGAAAVQMLTAASGAEGLDSLSPEAYSGFGEIATRLNRNVALLGATSRPEGDDKKWGFRFGYLGERVTSNSTSAYTSFKGSNDTAYLNADIGLGTKVRLNLSAGLDNGGVQARGFRGDSDSAVFGLGLGITPESKFARLDIGASFSTADFNAARQGATMSQDNQNAYAVAARVTFLPKEPPVNAVAQVAEGPRSKLSLVPYVGVSYASTEVDAFTESNVAGSAQLNVDGFSRRSLVGELGLNLEYEVGASTVLTGIVAYEHEFRNGGSTDIAAEFADTGVDDTGFLIHTDGYGANLFRVGVGIRQQLGAKSSFGLSYDALLGSGVTNGQQVKADVSFRF